MQEKHFDDFFVGKGSCESLNNKNSYSSQLIGIDSISDLKNKKDNPIHEPEDDLDCFSPDILEEISNIKEYVSVFISGKKYIFSIFNYIEKKSKSFGNIPIKEKDLILEDYDNYVIKYLMNNNVNKSCTVKNIAKLIACNDLRINEFKFINVHNCPLCYSHDSLVMSIEFALDALCSGSYVIHPNCEFDVIPVIRRGNYVGPIMDSLNVNFEKNGVIVESCPKEYKEKISEIIDSKEFSIVSKKTSYNIEKIIFCNMIEYYMNKISNKLSDPDGIFAYQDGNSIVINNNYIAHSGPFEHLHKYIMLNLVDESIDISCIPEDAEKFYMSGKEVILFNNKYWDIGTGKQIK